MKNKILFTVVLFATIFTSCKKNRICVCSTYEPSYSALEIGHQQTNQTYVMVDVTKKEAKNICSEHNTMTNPQTGEITTRECNLK